MTDGKPGIRGFETRLLEWRGVRLRYAVGGAGPPVALVHGLGGTIGNWRLVAPSLAERRRVVAVDLPGHGGSEPLPDAATVDVFAEAALAVLDA